MPIIAHCNEFLSQVAFIVSPAAIHKAIRGLKYIQVDFHISLRKTKIKPISIARQSDWLLRSDKLPVHLQYWCMRGDR